MKSSNDIYHGDEHLTDKPQKYRVRMSEVVYYEVEVEAIDKEEAEDLATATIAKNDSNEEYIYDTHDFQTDSISVIEEQQNYNYSYGGTE